MALGRKRERIDTVMQEQLEDEAVVALELKLEEEARAEAMDVREKIERGYWTDRDGKVYFETAEDDSSLDMEFSPWIETDSDYEYMTSMEIKFPDSLEFEEDFY